MIEDEHGPLSDGETRRVRGTTAHYRVNRSSISYSCSCPAWIYQRLPPSKRTCKHLIALRGEERERLRVSESEARPSAPTRLPEKPVVTREAPEPTSPPDPYVRLSDEDLRRLLHDPRVSSLIKGCARMESLRRGLVLDF